MTATGPAPRLAEAAQPGRRSRWPWVVVGIIAVVAFLVAWPPSRVTLQTLALVPSILGIGPQPLALAPEPRHVVVNYQAPDGETLPGDLWLPASASADRPVGAIVLVSGINSQGRGHPALAQVASAMARAGAAVYVPELPVFFTLQVDRSEVGRIVAAFEAVADQPEIDPGRIGIAGVSVGGSLSLIAAGDPAIADRLDWVAAFGAYAHASEIVTEVASHQYRLEGALVDWQPTLLVREVIFRILAAHVSHGRDHGYLYGAYEQAVKDGIHPIPNADVPLLTDIAHDVEAILVAETLPDAEAALADAPSALHHTLETISPLGEVGRIKAPVYLMHDTGDHHIAYVNSLTLAAAMEAAGADVRLGQFRLFDHVQPQIDDLLTATPEVWNLFWYLRDIAAQTL